jgi:hypothetical protein
VPPLEIPKAAAAAPATSGSRLGEVESTFSTALIPGVALAAAIAVIAVLGEALMRRVTGGSPHRLAASRSRRDSCGA